MLKVLLLQVRFGMNIGGIRNETDDADTSIKRQVSLPLLASGERIGGETYRPPSMNSALTQNLQDREAFKFQVIGRGETSTMISPIMLRKPPAI